MSRRVSVIGLIKFEDHDEDIIKVRDIPNVTKVFQIMTDCDIYVYDCTQTYGNPSSRGRLYKQVISKGYFPQTIQSQLQVCEFLDLVLFN